jgi:hypothetical protein
MDDIGDMLKEYLYITKDMPQETLDAAYMTERIRFFAKLRDLIQEKDYDNDQVASAILGWAYEKLAN